MGGPAYVLLGAAAVSLLAGSALAQDVHRVQSPAPRAEPGAAIETNYLELARANVPKTEQEWLLAERYLKLTREERTQFKIKNARTRKIELTAYSVCFYAQLKEGVGVRQSGEQCYWQLVGLN